ncbi:MAG: IS982 family transposase [Candidatus Marinimicrobia bacterium]|nr:IS982 family transposase [Candidatus Neomarinimicrobiota bacterium]
MHNLKKNFDRVLPIVQELLINDLDKVGNIPKPGPKPKFSDVEVITLSLVSDSLLIDSEHYLFKKLHSEYTSDFPNLIERSVYNKRRRFLTPLMNKVREMLVHQLVPFEDTFVIDSMPIEICKFARAKRLKICKEDEYTAPSYGYCAAQNQTYYGYKLHGVCTLEGVVTDFDLSKANVADIHYLGDIRDRYHSCTLLGDKAYLSNELQTELFETNRMILNSPMRANQKQFRKQPAVFRKVRKRIETIFSQLCDQFMIRRNYAKTFHGLASRILSKITAFTLLQYINKFISGRPLNHVKHALI